MWEPASSPSLTYPGRPATQTGSQAGLPLTRGSHQGLADRVPGRPARLTRARPARLTRARPARLTRARPARLTRARLALDRRAGRRGGVRPDDGVHPEDHRHP
eukprot:scaffold98566_cov60-Phaeocystis_antarctica.AAC.2